MDDNTITILEGRLEEALEALTKLAKKAQRYGTPKITWTLGGTREEVRQDREGHKVRVLVRDITLNELEAPRVGDFRFIARLERTPAGTIIDSIPGEELPERFRHSTGECEHCKTDRARAHLFVVRSPEGELVQVGRTCLRDYMGTDTPASVAARFRFLREASEWSDEFGGHAVFEDSALELLSVTHAAIRLWGWVPKSAPESAGKPTAFRVAAWFWCHPNDKAALADRDALRAAITEADRAEAQLVMDWVAGPEAGDSEYIHNLRMVLAPGVVTPKRRGIASSAVAAYQRHLGRLAEVQRRAAADARAAEVSRHIGAVGERLKGLKVRCESARGFDGAYGTSILYKLVDGSGNVLSWFSSGGADMDPGQEYTLDATVKAHAEYRGVAETQLTRAKVKEAV